MCWWRCFWVNKLQHVHLNSTLPAQRTCHNSKVLQFTQQQLVMRANKWKVSILFAVLSVPPYVQMLRGQCNKAGRQNCQLDRRIHYLLPPLLTSPKSVCVSGKVANCQLATHKPAVFAPFPSLTFSHTFLTHSLTLPALNIKKCPFPFSQFAGLYLSACQLKNQMVVSLFSSLLLSEKCALY